MPNRIHNRNRNYGEAETGRCERCERWKRWKRWNKGKLGIGSSRNPMQRSGCLVMREYSYAASEMKPRTSTASIPNSRCLTQEQSLKGCVRYNICTHLVSTANITNETQVWQKNARIHQAYQLYYQHLSRFRIPRFAMTTCHGILMNRDPSPLPFQFSSYKVPLQSLLHLPERRCQLRQ